MLDLQALDTSGDNLRNRLARLPEAQVVSDLLQQHQALQGEVRDLRVQVTDVTDEQSRADADVEQVKSRQQRDQSMVDSGAISDPKALERMLGELESLAKRISDLEDVELEVMERLEQLQGSLDAGEAQLVVLEGQIDQAKAALATQQAELKTEFTQVQGERAQLASAIPEDLMALYERIREHKGGVAAAALRRKECLGCGLVLNTAELAMVASAPADDVLRCEECSRILVRTSESGL